MLTTLFSTSGNHVSYSEVKAIQTTNSTGQANVQNVSASAGDANLQVVTKYFPGGVSDFKNWLDGLDEAQQREFVQNMAEVIREAEAASADVRVAINYYFDLKSKKLHNSGLDKYENQARRAAVLGAIAFSVLVLGLSSMGLVLLSIERNTRRLA